MKTTTTTVTRKFHVARKAHGRQSIEAGTAPQTPPVGRLPRVTKLMALAIHFEELLRSGVVSSQAELAELGQVSRPRLTQIMNLLQLAPEIQEWLLFQPLITAGSDPLVEHVMRGVSAIFNWKVQQDQILSWKPLRQPSFLTSPS